MIEDEEFPNDIGNAQRASNKRGASKSTTTGSTRQRRRPQNEINELEAEVLKHLETIGRLDSENSMLQHKLEIMRETIAIRDEQVARLSKYGGVFDCKLPLAALLVQPRSSNGGPIVGSTGETGMQIKDCTARETARGRQDSGHVSDGSTSFSAFSGTSCNDVNETGGTAQKAISQASVTTIRSTTPQALTGAASYNVQGSCYSQGTAASQRLSSPTPCTEERRIGSEFNQTLRGESPSSVDCRLRSAHVAAPVRQFIGVLFPSEAQGHTNTAEPVRQAADVPSNSAQLARLLPTRTQGPFEFAGDGTGYPGRLVARKIDGHGPRRTSTLAESISFPNVPQDEELEHIKRMNSMSVSELLDCYKLTCEKMAKLLLLAEQSGPLGAKARTELEQALEQFYHIGGILKVCNPSLPRVLSMPISEGLECPTSEHWDSVTAALRLSMKQFAGLAVLNDMRLKWLGRIQKDHTTVSDTLNQILKEVQVAWKVSMGNFQIQKEEMLVKLQRVISAERWVVVLVDEMLLHQLTYIQAARFIVHSFPYVPDAQRVVESAAKMYREIEQREREAQLKKMQQERLKQHN